MKGILPVACRYVGYVLLIFSVLVPLLMYMFGLVHDGNLLYIKLGMKLVIWQGQKKRTKRLPVFVASL